MTDLLTLLEEAEKLAFRVHSETCVIGSRFGNKCQCRTDDHNTRVREHFAKIREALPRWMPIETAPKDGKPILVFHPVGGVCEAFCPDDGFAWHVMDGVNTAIGSKSGKSIPVLTSYLESPTHWQPLPAPPQGANHGT